MRVTPNDLSDWLINYVRATAADEGHDLDVDATEPETLELPLARPLVVIRDDPGSQLSAITFDHSVGFTVLGGTKNRPKPIRDEARWLAGLLRDPAIVLADRSPIARVEISGSAGPYSVPEQLDVVRFYGIASYVAVGSW